MGNEMLVSMTQDQMKDLIHEVVSNTLKGYYDSNTNNNSDLPIVREDYLTRDEVEKLLKVGYSTISEYIKKGLLKPHKYINNSHLFKKEDVYASFPNIKIN